MASASLSTVSVPKQILYWCHFTNKRQLLQASGRTVWSVLPELADNKGGFALARSLAFEDMARLLYYMDAGPVVCYIPGKDQFGDDVKSHKEM